MLDADTMTSEKLERSIYLLPKSPQIRSLFIRFDLRRAVMSKSLTYKILQGIETRGTTCIVKNMVENIIEKNLRNPRHSC